MRHPRSISAEFAELTRAFLAQDYAKRRHFETLNLHELASKLEAHDLADISESEKTSFHNCIGIYQIMLAELELNNWDHFPESPLHQLALPKPVVGTVALSSAEAQAFDSAANRLIELANHNVLHFSEGVLRKTVVQLRSTAIQMEIEKRLELPLEKLWEVRSAKLKPWMTIENNKVNFLSQAALDLIGPERSSDLTAFANTLKYLLLLPSKSQFSPTLQEMGFLFLLFESLDLEVGKPLSSNGIPGKEWARRLTELHRSKIKSLSLGGEISEELWCEFEINYEALKLALNNDSPALVPTAPIAKEVA